MRNDQQTVLHPVYPVKHFLIDIRSAFFQAGAEKPVSQLSDHISAGVQDSISKEFSGNHMGRTDEMALLH